jgi:hypothetical protein
MPAPTTDYYDHPIFHPATQLHFDTAASRALRDTIERWLWNGNTGGYFYGKSRVGKTHALSLLIDRFRTRANRPIPGHYLSVPQRDQGTIASTYRAMNFSAGLRVTNADKADVLCDRFVFHLSDRACEAASDMLLMVIDEMHRLKPQQLEAFAEIYDKLLKTDVVLTCVFVGNDPQHRDLTDELAVRSPHVYGRFFTQGHEVQGLTSEADVRTCLAQYDTLRHPDDGPTYTAFFLPEAVEAGWQLASLSAPLWAAFAHYRDRLHLGSWPMQYFITAVNTLLTDYLPRFGVEDVHPHLLAACIEVSGLTPSLVKAS